MSGTSLDGWDGVLAQADGNRVPQTSEYAHLPFAPALRAELLTLNRSGPDKLHRSALAANAIASLDGAVVALPLAAAGGLLAERSVIEVVCDFRSRDVAAGGQGAPLVPAFHAACFAQSGQDIAVLNLSGIASFTLLRANRQVLCWVSTPARETC